MTSIIFTVSDRAIDPATIGSEKEFVIEGDMILTELPPLKPVPNRSLARSMDGSARRGTLVGVYETSVIGITGPIERKNEIDELYFSLLNFKPAQLDATDVNYIAAVKTFVMAVGDTTPQTVGCTHYSLNFGIEILPD